MPKKSKKGSSRGKYNSNQGDSVTLRGRTLARYLTAADPGGAVLFGIHPLTMGGNTGIVPNRLTDICTLYQLYRYRRLEGSFLAGGTNASPSVSNSSIIMSVFPTVGTSVPPNAFDLLEAGFSAYSFNDQTVASHLKLPPKLLHGDKDYYATETAADSPCALLISCVDNKFLGVVGVATIVWDWEINFYGRTPTSITLDRMRQLVANHDHDEDSSEESAKNHPGAPPGWKLVKQ